MSVTVLRPGLLSSLQDDGRPGHAALGIGRSGAMDVPAWRLANALVGNFLDEAAIECTLSGPALRFAESATIALTGGSIVAHVDEHTIPMWTACQLPAGSVLQLGGMTHGCRAYLAVRGGFDVRPVLGSRSSDLHARIGYQDGRALRSGDVLAIGDAVPPKSFPARSQPRLARWGLDPRPWFDFAARPLALLRGSHWPQLDATSKQLLHGSGFLLSKDSNRTASRLDGHTLGLRAPFEMVSEVALPGTLQLPPSGRPIALLAEAPVTGGYPRIGQIAAVDLPRFAQLRPGDTVCFRESTLDEAIVRLAARQQRLARMLGAITQRLENAGPDFTA